MAGETTINSKPEAQAVAEIVQKYVAPQIIDLKRGDARAAAILVTAQGLQIHDLKPFLDKYLTAPERRTGTAQLLDLDSFIGHVDRYKDDGSALFGNPSQTTPSLTAVLDYSPAGAESAARFGTHRAKYDFPLSDEWKVWQAKNAKPMEQADFAAFIEDRIADIASPASAGEPSKSFAAKVGAVLAEPARLLELSRGLSVRVGEAVRNHVNLGTGEAQLQYTTTHSDEGGGALKVPGAFLVAIPVFRGGHAYEIAARLRYRVKEGSVTWFYELYRTDRIFDHAFTEACTIAKEKTALPLMLGSPE